jgi:hypothetical protein
MSPDATPRRSTPAALGLVGLVGLVALVASCARNRTPEFLRAGKLVEACFESQKTPTVDGLHELVSEAALVRTELRVALHALRADEVRAALGPRASLGSGRWLVAARFEMGRTAGYGTYAGLELYGAREVLKEKASLFRDVPLGGGGLDGAGLPPWLSYLRGLATGWEEVPPGEKDPPSEIVGEERLKRGLEALASRPCRLLRIGEACDYLWLVDGAEEARAVHLIFHHVFLYGSSPCTVMDSVEVPLPPGKDLGERLRGLTPGGPRPIGELLRGSRAKPR